MHLQMDVADNIGSVTCASHANRARHIERNPATTRRHGGFLAEGLPILFPSRNKNRISGVRQPQLIKSNSQVYAGRWKSRESLWPADTEHLWFSRSDPSGVWSSAGNIPHANNKACSFAAQVFLGGGKQKILLTEPKCRKHVVQNHLLHGSEPWCMCRSRNLARKPSSKLLTFIKLNHTLLKFPCSVQNICP